MQENRDGVLRDVIKLITSISPDSEGRVRLPTERVMASQLQIQRTTVRERLSILEMFGFIKRTQGSGTYLTLGRPTFMQEYFEIALRLDYIRIDEMQGAMEMIVREATASAAASASGENLRRLKELVEETESDTSLDGLVRSQFEFLSLLVRASENPVIVIIFDGIAMVVREVLRRRLNLIKMVPGALNRNLNARRQVVDAILNREPDTTRSAIDEYFWLWRREEAKISIMGMEEYGGM